MIFSMMDNFSTDSLCIQKLGDKIQDQAVDLLKHAEKCNQDKTRMLLRVHEQCWVNCAEITIPTEVN